MTVFSAAHILRAALELRSLPTITSILFVEDHPEIRGFTVAFLRHRGYRVAGVASGSGALKMIQRSSFDLVIADHNLFGDITGLEVLASHKHVAPSAHRILLTAECSEQLRDRCRYLDALYLQKPVLLDELVRKIESLTSS